MRQANIDAVLTEERDRGKTKQQPKFTRVLALMECSNQVFFTRPTLTEQQAKSA